MRNFIGNASNKLKKLASSTGNMVSSRADNIAMELRNIREAISMSSTSSLEQYLDRVFPKSTAPAYIIHNSNAVNDYAVHFNLSQVLAQLDAGILSRPCVVLYCGRSDIDRDILSKRVTQEFLKEMSKHEQRVKELAERDRAKHRESLEKSVNRVIIGAAEAAFMRVLLTMVTGPLGILILLLMGSVKRTVDCVYELISMPKKLIMASVESIAEPRKNKKINAAFDEEQKKVNKALNNLDLKLHEDLIALAWSYDNMAYPLRGERVSDALPEHIVNIVRQRGGEYLPKRLR